MNKRSSSNRSQDINIDDSDVHKSQFAQGEKVTQIQIILGGLGDTFPEYFDSFEKKIIGISIASSGLSFLVLIIAKSVLSDVVVPSTLIGFIIFIVLVMSLSFVTARIIIRYIRSQGTFWNSLKERDRQIIDAYLDKVHRGIKKNFENSFNPKENYVSLSGDSSGDVYPHQAYEEKAPKFRRQISNLDSYILSPVNKQVFLYGPPGSGKSTTLYKTFLTYKENALHRRSDYIPVFIHANEISQVLSPSIPSTIYEFLSDINKVEDSRDIYNFIRLIHDNSKIRLVVIVDALDEFLDKTKRSELFNYLHGLIQNTVDKGTKWILSCREEEYDAYRHTLNVANIRIKAMSLKQVEEFLKKRLRTLQFDDVLYDNIRCKVRALANALDQQEFFLKNPYYLSLWLSNIRTADDIAIPSINKLHIEELKREITKGMGISHQKARSLDDFLINNIISVLSVFSFFLLKASLQTEFHQGIKIHELNILQSLMNLLVVIEEDSLDQITKKRLRAYSETILNSNSVNGIQNNLPNEENDYNFFILLGSIYDEVFKYSSKLGFKNKQQMTKFIIVFASLIEQSHKYRLIRIDLHQALLYGFLNQRAGDYLAACFLRDSGLSKVLKEKPNFWLFRSISLALASSEKPQEILNAIDKIPEDHVLETAIVNGLTLLQSKQRSNVSSFIERFTEHLLNHDRLFGESSDPCDPLRVLRQIRRLCVNGYSQQIELSDHLFKDLLLHPDSSISESATLTYLTHSCQVKTSRKRRLFLFNFFVKRAIRFEFRESFSSLWLIIKESQT